MRILFLTQIIPYPPDSGPKVKTYHVLRYLAEKGHQIFLASFVRPEEEKHVDALRGLCAEVHCVPIRRSRLTDGLFWLRSHLTGRPFLIERDDLDGMRKAVSDLLADKSIDCIHADQLTMAQFGLPPAGLFGGGLNGNSDQDSRQAGKRPGLVFDAHNAVWTIVERMQQTVPAILRPLLRPVLALEAVRVKRYEGMILEAFDHTLAVTGIDDKDLRTAWQFAASRASGRNASFHDDPDITTIPIAVDCTALQPVQRKPGSLNILTLGTLHYPPNADGIRWFVREVFPGIQKELPNVTLTIAGKNPPADFIQLAQASANTIQVTGYVPDLLPLMEAASLVVVPVRAGSGMRVRILEAFARGMPVVTTTIGLEGITARPNVDVLVEDTAEDFRDAVVALLQDAELQQRLAKNGRTLAENVYDWKVALQRLEKVYGAE